jgi:hypothetical protein
MATATSGNSLGILSSLDKFPQRDAVSGWKRQAMAAVLFEIGKKRL